MSPSPPPDPSGQLRDRVLTELGVDAANRAFFRTPYRSVPLPSRLSTGELAWASVTSLASALDLTRIPDPERIALAYRSDRLLTIDGVAPPIWSPYSGFWRTRDGWVRTHGNYPHHADALLRGLGVTDHPDRLHDVFAAQTSAEAVRALTDAGGLAVHVVREDPTADAALRRSPLLDIRRLDGPAGKTSANGGTGEPPLSGVRVLDLTRVIAGPVCTRTLALLGADVLRIDPPRLPEPEWQHLDTGHGKRSAVLDARAPELSSLLALADVVVVGYRPSALAHLGLSPEALAERYPGLVVAQLSAWGRDRPERAGFDSLVQAESGIALVESLDGERPGALPAQALDHSAGYLLATAVIALLQRRRSQGGSWTVHTSLRRIAAELLGMPRRESPATEADIDPAPHTATFRVGGRILTTARPALPGLEFRAPREWGADQARW